MYKQSTVEAASCSNSCTCIQVPPKASASQGIFQLIHKLLGFIVVSTHNQIVHYLLFSVTFRPFISDFTLQENCPLNRSNAHSQNIVSIPGMKKQGEQSAEKCELKNRYRNLTFTLQSLHSARTSGN